MHRLIRRIARRLTRVPWPALPLAAGLAFVPGARAEQTVEVIPLNYIDAREAADVVNALFANEVRATAFPPTNSLLLNLNPSSATGNPAMRAPAPTDPRRYPAGAPFGRNTFGQPGGQWGNPIGGVYSGPVPQPVIGTAYGPVTAPNLPAPPTPHVPIHVTPEAPPTP